MDPSLPWTNYRQHINTPAYAAAARAAESTSSAGSTQISSPTTSTFIDWQKEKPRARSATPTASNTDQNRFRLELQEKISRSRDLEEKLAQALELADIRDKRHEEMMTQIRHSVEAMHQSSMVKNPVVAALPSTPIRKNANKPAPPPPKKEKYESLHRTEACIPS
jgi:hypothetical protein